MRGLGSVYDSDYIDLLFKLRYGCDQYGDQLRPILNYTQIARLLHKSPETVRSHCLLALNLKRYQLNSKHKRPRIFKQHHNDYHIDDKTLKYWAHFSLAQRAVMIHRQFSELHISAQSIANIYKKNGISYKTVYRIKRVIDFNVPFYKTNSNYIFDQMQRAQEHNIKFIHADEAVFTFNTFISSSWYKIYSNIEVYDQNVKVQYMLFLEEYVKIVAARPMLFSLVLQRLNNILSFYNNSDTNTLTKRLFCTLITCQFIKLKTKERNMKGQTQHLYLMFLTALSSMELNYIGGY